MGSGGYSLESRVERATKSGFYSKPIEQVLTNYELSNQMNPMGVDLRESRDSQEHPESVAIGIALDVTGSMQKVPERLVRDGLPNIMGKIIQRGIDDPQVLFMGIGDHECDRAPFQVGQFESSDELLDKWLTDIYLESGGGGNDGESYLLAWYFAGHRTAIDCFEKRGQKGFLFTIGDEPTLRVVPSESMGRMFGNGQYENFTAENLLSKAQEMYNVYHLHIMETSRGKRAGTVEGWQRLIGENLITIQGYQEIAQVISDIVIQGVNGREEYTTPSTPFDQENDSDHSYTPPQGL